jgi:hypothetical protein
MKETKKKVKKAPKQKQKQKQEQNVVVNINQPAKPKHKKRPAIQKNDDKQQQQYKGPIMAPTYNPPIVIREPASTQNELLAKLFEKKQERENNTQPNLLVGARVPNVETRQERAHNDLERTRGKRVAKLDVATAPLPAKSDLVHPEYQEASQSVFAAFRERLKARPPLQETATNDSLLKSLRETASAPFKPLFARPQAKAKPPEAVSLKATGPLDARAWPVSSTEAKSPEDSSLYHEMLTAPTIISLVDQLNLGEQPEAPEHSTHKAAPVADLEAEVLFSGGGQEGEFDEPPLEEAQPRESVSLESVGQGPEELTSQLTTTEPPIGGGSVEDELSVVEGKTKTKRGDFGFERGKQRPPAQVELRKFIDMNVRTDNGKIRELREKHSMNKGALMDLVNTEAGYATAQAILANIGLNYVEPDKAKYF